MSDCWRDLHWLISTLTYLLTDCLHKIEGHCQLMTSPVTLASVTSQTALHIIWPETSFITVFGSLLRSFILFLCTLYLLTGFTCYWVCLITACDLAISLTHVGPCIVERIREKSCKLWYKHQIWHSEPHGYTNKIYPIGHLKIQHGSHFSRWPPNRRAENTFHARNACILSI